MKNSVLWLTGLPCSGKTTIAKELLKILNTKYNNIIWIDGDVNRNINKNNDYTVNGRYKNIYNIINLCKENYNNIIIVSSILPFRKMREVVKTELGDRYIEIYIQCSIKECIKRDVKGLYKMALNGKINNFTGINQLYEEPVNPHLVINTEFFSINQCIDYMLNELKF